MPNALTRAFAQRIAHLTLDARGPLLAAYDCYLAGHVPEGLACLGIDYTGQTAPDLLVAIEEAAK